MKTCVEFDRRQFLAMGLALWSGTQGKAFCQPGESARSQPVLGPGPGSGRVLKIAPRDGAELQSTLWRQAETGNTLQLPAGANLILTPREERVGPHQEISRHPLLIPPGVRLDLNGATLQLELTVNCYGVRLSNDSALRKAQLNVELKELELRDAAPIQKIPA